jgi:bidirectional [NiFe] hydrogenase diaphorase subunit
MPGLQFKKCPTKPFLTTKTTGKPVQLASILESNQGANQPTEHDFMASDQGTGASDKTLDIQFAAYLDGQGRNQDALIEILNRCQAIHGYVSRFHLRQIAQHLFLPYSRVWGTASFYNLFHFDPPPQHSYLICTGTACFVKGADHVLKQLQGDGVQQMLKQQGIQIGTVRCIGTCGGAPLVVIDGDVCNHQSAKSVLTTLAGLQP